ncbi:patatin-like phospholipase family protein [Leptothrix discophora]|uniref:Patatin-like phospholipase family protein n=1 Tax=Leptothrix discophora TaxID=89 RepID=A0ABT9FXV9_LEPDI|nr:patatin-like phospholipase family protein [Leptothrix discophora]MDP4299071.1 patatin-like phospholipase family protein [Leptothrix discophora]
MRSDPRTPAGDACDIETVLAAERQWLGLAPGADGRAEPLSALCLSGGGIRSATFSLGVLQGLARRGELGRFHYLSTVSGGGYIGSWLSSWIRHRSLADVNAALAGAEPGSRAEPEPLHRLRAYANYLSPVRGLSTDSLSLAAIFLRNITLHWLVVLPLMAAALLLPRLMMAMVNGYAVPAWLQAGTPWAGVALLVMAIAYMVADLPGETPPKAPPNRANVYCLGALLVAAVLLSWSARWQVVSPDDGMARLMLYSVLAHALGVVVGLAWRHLRGLGMRRRGWGILLLDLGFMVASGVAGGMVLYGAVIQGAKLTPAWYATLSVPALLMVFWVGMTCHVGLSARCSSEDDREWWARAGAWWLGAGMAWLLVALIVLHLPGWLLATPPMRLGLGPQTAGVGAALIGLVTTLVGFWSKNGADVRSKAQTLAELTGTRLLDLGALVSTLALVLGLSYALSCSLRVADAVVRTGQLDATVAGARAWQDEAALQAALKQAKAAAAASAAASAAADVRPEPVPMSLRAALTYETVLDESDVDLLLGAMLVLALFGLAMSAVVGVNTFSLHNMYGNRLQRAFLGATREHRRPHAFTGFDPRDNILLAELAHPPEGPRPPEERRLLPVINVALNLVKPSGGRLEWQQRKAASFTMTPLHCGNDRLGYAPTWQYGGRMGLTLGRAMTISGAAASPNMGYHTSRLVAFLMTFFNARLGCWLPNPRTEKRRLWKRQEPLLGLPNLLREAAGATSEDRDFVFLSDGGHFENLGLYEMVRRQCARIVVVDAGCDPNYCYDDLHDAIRKVRIDFGVEIVFDPDHPLPRPEAGKTLDPKAHAIRHATIDYSRVPCPPGQSPPPNGQLTYIKPVLTGQEPLDVLHYARVHDKPGKAFPHQSTADQFFDEGQFESYRRLGEWVVMGPDGDPLANAPAAPSGTSAATAPQTAHA